MIELQGSYTFDAPQEVVWAAVRDPQVLSQVLPGCERLVEVGENEYEGEINIRIGPVQGAFAGKVILSHVNPPESYHIDLQGRGPAGFVKGEGDLKLESVGSQTTLTYTGSASVSGRIANVGQRLMDSSARSITRQGLESLDNLIQIRLKGPEEPAAGPAIPTALPTAPSTTQVAATVAKDVAKDVIADLGQPEQQSTLRATAVITLGVIAILWMYRLLFGKE
jgi:uncharacterized protein